MFLWSLFVVYWDENFSGCSKYRIIVCNVLLVFRGIANPLEQRTRRLLQRAAQTPI